MTTLPEKRLARQGTLQRDLNTLIDHVAYLEGGGAGADDHIENASNEGVYVDADGTVTVLLGDSAGTQRVLIKNKDGATVASVDSEGKITAAKLDSPGLQSDGDADTTVVLGDDEGVHKFVLKDSEAVTIAVIDSQGNLEVIGQIKGGTLSTPGLQSDVAGDTVIQLGDNAGEKRLWILDSDGEPVASIDSDGVLRVPGMDTTVAGNLIVRANTDYSPWWDLEDGSCLGAWQALGGVESLEESKLDLTENGHDLYGGVDPGWDNVNGWSWNGSTQFLQTGITLQANYTIIYRFTGVATTYGAVMGVFRSGAAMCFYPDYYNDYRYLYGYAYVDRGVAKLSSGILALAGEQPYLNGAPDGSPLATQWNSGNEDECYIGGANGGIAKSLCLHKSQAAAIYNRKLTADEIAALYTRMSTLSVGLAAPILIVQNSSGVMVMSARADGGIDLGTAHGASAGGVRYSGSLEPLRGEDYYTGRLLVLASTAHPEGGVALTDSPADLISHTETVPAGRIVLTACIELESEALDAINQCALCLCCDGVEVDSALVTLHAVGQTLRVTLTWSGAIAAGSKTWKVTGANLDDDATNDANANAASILSWQVYT